MSWRGWKTFSDPPPRSGRYMAYLLCEQTYWMPEIEWDAEQQAIVWAEWTPESSQNPAAAEFLFWRKLPPEPGVDDFLGDSCPPAKYIQPRRQ